MNPIISIVIPSYNSLKLIQNWEYRNNPNFFARIEFIFIDSKTDSESKKILNYLDITYINFKFISSITSLYEAMNLGIEYATGKYVAFMGVDDKLTPEVNKFIDFLIENETESSDLYVLDYSILFKNKNKMILKQKSSQNNLLFPHHQSCFFKLDSLKKTNIKFDCKFQVYSDLDFIFRFTSLNSTKYLNYSCIEFSTGGKSTNGNYFLQSIFELFVILKFHNKLLTSFFFMSLMRISYYHFKYSLFQRRIN